MKALFCATTALGVLLSVGAGHAQTNTDNGQQASTLDTVVVTAERRQTDLQRTPLSLIALGSQALEERGIATTEDLAHFTPGLSAGGDVEGGSTHPVFAIRGVGQSSGRDTIESGVAIYVDDVYLPRTTGAFLQLVDIERVEVLRGPQGTLFGRNSTGGALRYVTKVPSHETEASISATAGSYNRVDLAGLVNIPLGDLAAVRLQAGSFKRDGYVAAPDDGRALGDTNDTVLRGTLRVWANDRLTVDLGASYQRSKTRGPAQTILALSTASVQTQALSKYLTNQGQPALKTDDARFVLGDRYANAGNCYLGNNSYGIANANNLNTFGDRQGYCDRGVDQENVVGFAKVDYALTDRLNLRSITGAISGKSTTAMDWSGLGLGYVGETSDYSSFSEEVQLSYSGDRLNAVGGVYYFSEHPIVQTETRNIVYQGAASPNTGLCCTGLSRHRDLKTESVAVFGQLTYELTDALSVILGGRYGEDQKRITVSRKDRPTARPGQAFTGSDEWSAFNYRATLQYQATPDIMVYGTASNGFKAGGFNDDIQAGPATNGGITAYAPEKVDSLEAGIRSQFFDRRLRVNLTGFRMDYKDMQLATPVFDTTGGSVSVLLLLANAGQVRLSGLEADVTARVTDAFSVNASVATLSQTYEDLAPGSALLITSTCANPNQPTLATCQAQRLARAPKLQYTVGATYDYGFSRGNIAFSAAYAWTASQQSSNSTANSWLLPSYGLANLRAEFTPRDADWSVAVFGTNVFDEYYLTTATDFRGFYGSVVGAPGRPSEFGAEIKYKF